jgi:hypothetical protein
MAAKREIFLNRNQPYHILNRAVERREIFAKEGDCLRFIFQMYAANVGKPASNLHRKDVIKAAYSLLAGEEISSKFIIKEHPPLVNFLSFVLVINHYHFNLFPNIENGIPIYMQRLNIGFAKYFNLKHNRKGTLFESRYKIVPIQTNFQLDAVLRYINIINPLDVYQPGWRKEGLKNGKEALKFLNEYQYSSFPDLFGKRKSKILTSRELIVKFFGKEAIINQEEYLKFAKDFLEQRIVFPHPLYLE